MNEIETMFLNAVMQYVNGCSLEEVNDLEDQECSAHKFEPQKVVGIYRPDFVVTTKCLNKKYIVEIDGHESHKTKEQRKNDYERERYFQRNGYTVVRFMATEVFLEPEKCVEEMFEIFGLFDSEIIDCMADAYRSATETMDSQ